MTAEESTRLADEMFEKLKSALMPGGWAYWGSDAYPRELHWEAAKDHSIAGVRVLTNLGYGDCSGIPSIQVNRWDSTRSVWAGKSVEEAIKRALALGSTLTQEREEGAEEGAEMKVVIARLSVTWSSIGTASQVASALESLAAKIRSEGDPVDLKATLRYESKDLKKKMKGENDCA